MNEIEISRAAQEASTVQTQIKDLRIIYRDYLLKVAAIGISLHSSRTLDLGLYKFKDTSIPGYEFQCAVQDPESGYYFALAGSTTKITAYRVSLSAIRKEEQKGFFITKTKTTKHQLFSLCVVLSNEQTLEFFRTNSWVTAVYFSEENLPEISEYISQVKRLVDVSNSYLETI